MNFLKKYLLLLVAGLLFNFQGSWAMEEGKSENLLEKKISNTNQVVEVSEGWYDARLITRGTQFYLKNDTTFTLLKDESDPINQQLYKKIPNIEDHKSPSHSLVKTPSLSLGASVVTSIKTEKKRQKEKKGTHVQYDKDDIKQTGKDFTIDPCRLNMENEIALLTKKNIPKSNYEGGHLIDHKFSAQGSHTDNSNYVPQLYFYNAPVKEFIVKSADGYLEVPLFTPNPPKIKVLSENRYDSIPIGLLLVPLKNQQIKAMYYFPNNQYNYKKFQSNMKIEKQIAEQMVPCFKLKTALHALLWPAIIYDLKEKNMDLNLQVEQENKGRNIIDQLSFGMHRTERSKEDKDILSKLAFDVLYRSNVDLLNILDSQKNCILLMNKDQLNQNALNQSFNTLGQFLVEYGMKNALKSEVLSTHSRITFANLITDLFEEFFAFNEEALGRLDEAYEGDYQKTLDELFDRRKEMLLGDLIYLANLYQSLSSPFMHAPLTMSGCQICDGITLENNLKKFVEILGIVYTKAPESNFNPQQGQNMIDLFLEAQKNLSYFAQLGFPFEFFEQERNFLKQAKKQVQQWNQLYSTSSGTYQTSPNSNLLYTRLESSSALDIKFLGTNSSRYYPKEFDSEEEIGSDDTVEDGFEEEIKNQLEKIEENTAIEASIKDTAAEFGIDTNPKKKSERKKK